MKKLVVLLAIVALVLAFGSAWAGNALITGVKKDKNEAVIISANQQLLYTVSPGENFLVIFFPNAKFANGVEGGEYQAAEKVKEISVVENSAGVPQVVIHLLKKCDYRVHWSSLLSAVEVNFTPFEPLALSEEDLIANDEALEAADLAAEQDAKETKARAEAEAIQEETLPELKVEAPIATAPAAKPKKPAKKPVAEKPLTFIIEKGDTAAVFGRFIIGQYINSAVEDKILEYIPQIVEAYKNAPVGSRLSVVVYGDCSINNLDYDDWTLAYLRAEEITRLIVEVFAAEGIKVELVTKTKMVQYGIQMVTEIDANYAEARSRGRDENRRAVEIVWQIISPEGEVISNGQANFDEAGMNYEPAPIPALLPVKKPALKPTPKTIPPPASPPPLLPPITTSEEKNVFSGEVGYELAQLSDRADHSGYALLQVMWSRSSGIYAEFSGLNRAGDKSYYRGDTRRASGGVVIDAGDFFPFRQLKLRLGGGFCETVEKVLEYDQTSRIFGIDGGFNFQLTDSIRGEGDFFFPVEKGKADWESEGINTFRQPVDVKALLFYRVLSTDLLDLEVGGGYVNLQEVSRGIAGLEGTLKIKTITPSLGVYYRGDNAAVATFNLGF